MIGKREFHVAILVLVLTMSVIVVPRRGHAASSTVLSVYFEGVAQTFVGQPPADRALVHDFTRVTGQPVEAVTNQDPVKILASIESGNAPDLVILALLRPNWIYQGAMTPLDNYMKASHFNLSKFTDTAWSLGHVNGHYYTMSPEQDSIDLLYNKALFRRAGLDPNKPPQTLSQLLDYAKKLTVFNRDGSIKQLGLMPNGNINGGGIDYFQLWGNVFGGAWYDQAHEKTTAVNAHNVQALTWLANYWKQIGPSKLDRFESGFGTAMGPNDPFVRGQEAMIIDGDWWPFGLLPKGFDLGASYIPYPDGHPELAHRTASPSDVMFIPKGSPHADLAWKFINWYMNSESEQLKLALPTGITGYPLLKSALSKPLDGPAGAQPVVRQLEHILLTSHGTANPLVMPISQKFLQNLDYDGQKVLHGQENPLAALHHVDQVSQPTLDQALRQLRS